MPDQRAALDRSGARRVAVVSLLATAAVASAKLAAGVLSGSVALVGDGIHSALDLGAGGLTLLALRLAAKPPDREHPYGHGRAENLAALAQSAVMVLAGAGVALEALRRLIEGSPGTAPSYALAVAGGAIVVDAWRSTVLRRAAKRYSSPALHADAMNFTADIFESGAVLVGLMAVRIGAPAGDPVAALVVVAIMWVMAGRVGGAAVNVLMDRRPSTLADRVAEAAGSVDGVVEVKDLRVRRSGPDTHAEVTVSVGRTTSVERSHGITEAVEAAVGEAVSGATSTVHVEPSREGEDIVARTFAAANRIGMADQIHNVLAIQHPEGLWLMLHAKVPPHMQLGTAHAVTLELEHELRREIDGIARVEIHLEPREPRSLRGTVTSAQSGDLTAQVRRIAEAYPPISRCHEVAVSEASDGQHLVLHCEAPAGISIREIHDASLEVEDEIHRRYRDVRTVTVHFEPEEG